jgi:hypothetical protein
LHTAFGKLRSISDEVKDTVTAKHSLKQLANKHSSKKNHQLCVAAMTVHGIPMKI